MERHLFAIQRITALILAPLVLIHLGLILWAVDGGLTAAEILGRTRGSFLWAGFYTVFVGVASAHGAIGLRNILVEWGKLAHPAANRVAAGVALILLLLGLRAVWAVT